MKETITNLSELNSFACWVCKMSDISYGDHEDNIHCNYYEKTFYQKHKDKSFSIPIENNKPYFCKVKKIIVVEED